MSLSGDERGFLLRTARDAVEAAACGRRYVAPEAPAALREKRGAFVTLHTRPGGELRGCIGFVEPKDPLVDTVAAAAVAAAREDPRFPPVGVGELPRLWVEVSVLGPLMPIQPDAVIVGRHGLLLRASGRSGLLLPQVALEQGWDRETLLAMTCRKAGLSRDAWRRADARLFGFEAEVLGEHDARAPAE